MEFTAQSLTCVFVGDVRCAAARQKITDRVYVGGFALEWSSDHCGVCVCGSLGVMYVAQLFAVGSRVRLFNVSTKTGHCGKFGVLREYRAKETEPTNPRCMVQLDDGRVCKVALGNLQAAVNKGNTNPTIALGDQRKQTRLLSGSLSHKTLCCAALG